MSWVAVAGAAVSVIGGAVVANNSPKPQAPTPRSLGGELGNINQSYGDVLHNYLTGSPSVTNNALGNINSLASGNFNAARFFADQPDWEFAWNSDHQNGGFTGDPVRANWTPEDYARYAFHGDQSKIDPYRGGGVTDLAAQLNTNSRTANLQDVQNLGGQYTNLTRGANQDYYNALNSYTTATQQPVNPNATQTLAQDRAAQGFGTFDPSGLQANTSFNAQNVNASQGSPLLSHLNDQAMNAGPSGLQQQQNSLASNLLSLGGQLSPSDLRNVQQSSRAGFASRGLDATNASVVDETMQTDAAQRARLIQNLGIAQSVQNQGLSEQNQQNQFGLGVSNQNFGYGQLGLQGQVANQNANLQAQSMGLQGQLANQNFALSGFNSNLASQSAQQAALNQSAGLLEQQRQAQLAAQGNAVNLQRGGYLDPYAAIIGGADQSLLGQVLGQNSANQNTQANLYSGLLGYGSDLNNTNYNANAAAGIAGYNGQQALYGSLIQAGGGIASSYLQNRQPTSNQYDQGIFGGAATDRYQLGGAAR